jgi:hypothetical protein
MRLASQVSFEEAGLLRRLDQRHDRRDDSRDRSAQGSDRRYAHGGLLSGHYDRHRAGPALRRARHQPVHVLIVQPRAARLISAAEPGAGQVADHRPVNGTVHGVQPYGHRDLPGA